jgi:glycosyltransferase involved in cell wall biosynthesis
MKRSPDYISVILSTFNQPRWLSKVLAGYARQSHERFEIIVADDGSTVETDHVVDQFIDQSKVQIRHVWHPDDGFRKTTILNQAIKVARGDYLLFSDGDCIPRSDFVAKHHQHAAPMTFLSGGYYKLPMDLSERITNDDIRNGDAFHLSWLRRNGLPFSHRWMRIAAGRRTAGVLNALTTTRPTWNGNNSSGWHADLLAAGGFDQRMRYGGEDRELGERLENAGIRGKHVRFDTLLLHLDHGRGYANPEDLATNLAIRDETSRSGRTRTEFGLPERRAA